MCNSCDAVSINGTYCHEHGCPDSWKTEKRECDWCGFIFEPTNKDQKHCSKDCLINHWS